MTISPTLQVLLPGSVLHLGGTEMGKVLNDFSVHLDNRASETDLQFTVRGAV